MDRFPSGHGICLSAYKHSLVQHQKRVWLNLKGLKTEGNCFDFVKSLFFLFIGFHVAYSNNYYTIAELLINNINKYIFAAMSCLQYSMQGCSQVTLS